MKEQINKTAVIRLRVTPYFKDEVEKMAYKEGLSISAYITRLLKLQINGKDRDKSLSRK